MARTNNLLLQNASGHIGRQFVIKQYGDKTIIAKFPEFSKKRKFTVKQQDAQLAMQLANWYAKWTLENDPERNAAQLRLNVTRNRLYPALIKEYFANTKLGKEFVNGKWK
jgi:hypothetical protein